MNILNELYRITKDMHAFFQEENVKEDREGVIEKIEHFLSQRDALLPLVPLPLDEQNQRILREIVQHNQVIITKMQHLQSEIKKDLMNLKKRKTTSEGYQQMYQPVLFDGVFIDKKN